MTELQLEFAAGMIAMASIFLTVAACSAVGMYLRPLNRTRIEPPPPPPVPPEFTSKEEAARYVS